MWNPPPDRVTRPDQIDPRALSEVDFLDGERIARCWKTGLGFLLLTNLRCARVWHRPEVFRATAWHLGPSFFFYNLAEPRVVARRFVELREEIVDTGGSARFLVEDPADVAREIEAARGPGRAEWEARRARALAARPHPTPGDRGSVRVVVREIVKVRCRYCSNLMDVGAANCPTCGAPQT